VRLTNNTIMRSTPPPAGAADVRIAKAVGFDWLHAPGLSGWCKKPTSLRSPRAIIRKG